MTHMKGSPEATTSDERRIVPRTRVELPITYQVTGVAAEADVSSVHGEGHLADLSVAGAAFSAEVDLPLETTLRITIPAPNLKLNNESEISTPLQRSIKGKIVNRREIEGGNWRYGVKFDKLYYTLAGWVDELASLDSQLGSSSPGNN